MDNSNTGNKLKQVPIVKYTYTVKVINENKKQSTITRLKYSDRFSSMTELTKSIANIIPEKIIEVGYIEPGHGMKGKKHWMVRDDDLEELYECYGESRDIRLWCQVSLIEGCEQRKRTSSKVITDKPSKKSPNTPTCSEALNEVEKIVVKLKDVHKNAYTIEQYNCWSHDTV